VLFLAVLSAVARAEHADIDLIVARLAADTGSSLEETKASADLDPPEGGRKPRPLARVKAGEPLALQFVFTNTYPHGVTKGVVVRYFIVRETKARQKKAPDPRYGAVTQGKFRLNFKPKGRVGARVLFTVKSPGLYLLRVESVHTESDHEHFAAIDLQVD